MNPGSLATKFPSEPSHCNSCVYHICSEGEIWWCDYIASTLPSFDSSTPSSLQKRSSPTCPSGSDGADTPPWGPEKMNVTQPNQSELHFLLATVVGYGVVAWLTPGFLLGLWKQSWSLLMQDVILEYLGALFPLIRKRLPKNTRWHQGCLGMRHILGMVRAPRSNQPWRQFSLRTF